MFSRYVNTNIWICPPPSNYRSFAVLACLLFHLRSYFKNSFCVIYWVLVFWYLYLTLELVVAMVHRTLEVNLLHAATLYRGEGEIFEILLFCLLVNFRDKMNCSCHPIIDTLFSPKQYICVQKLFFLVLNFKTNFLRNICITKICKEANQKDSKVHLNPLQRVWNRCYRYKFII